MIAPTGSDIGTSVTPVTLTPGDRIAIKERPPPS